MVDLKRISRILKRYKDACLHSEDNGVSGQNVLEVCVLVCSTSPTAVYNVMSR